MTTVRPSRGSNVTLLSDPSRGLNRGKIALSPSTTGSNPKSSETILSELQRNVEETAKQVSEAKDHIRLFKIDPISVAPIYVDSSPVPVEEKLDQKLKKATVAHENATEKLKTFKTFLASVDAPTGSRRQRASSPTASSGMLYAPSTSEKPLAPSGFLDRLRTVVTTCTNALGCGRRGPTTGGARSLRNRRRKLNKKARRTKKRRY